MCGLSAILAVALLVAPCVVEGASFNCSKAITDIEKSICANEELSNLDEQVAKAYKSALKKSDTPGDVKRQQQEWLKNFRNQCRNEDCLKDVYEQRLTQLSVPSLKKWHTFRDSNLGIEFSYPSHREVKIDCHGSVSCIALIGSPMPNSEYLIAFEVFEGDLATVAEDNAVFFTQNGGWIAKGRSGEHPVDLLAGAGWNGLKSIVDCGISDRNGFHAGAGECMWVVLSDGRRSVVVDTQGIVGIDEASMQSIRSFRFSK